MQNTGGMWQLYYHFKFNRAQIHGRDGEKEAKMTEKDFIDLLRAYDALRDLRVFLGVDDIAFGFDSVLERLNVSDVITRHSALGEDAVGEVLDDRESSLEERARHLLTGS